MFGIVFLKEYFENFEKSAYFMTTPYYNNILPRHVCV